MLCVVLEFVKRGGDKLNIPKHTVGRRFYVAKNDKEAFSSWDNLEDALECVNRFRYHDPEQYDLICAIIETGPGERQMHNKEKWMVLQYESGNMKGQRFYCVFMKNVNPALHVSVVTKEPLETREEAQQIVWETNPRVMPPK